MNKLALEPNEILETHSYIIEGIETPADQGFMIPKSFLEGNWRICESELNPWILCPHLWNMGVPQLRSTHSIPEDPAAHKAGAQEELENSLQTTFTYGHLPVSKGLSGSKRLLVPPQPGRGGLSSGNISLLGNQIAQHAPALGWWQGFPGAMPTQCGAAPTSAWAQVAFTCTAISGDITPVPHCCAGSIWDSDA